METLAREAIALAEDDLVDLWLELTRDVIEHARITREWLALGLRRAENPATHQRLAITREQKCRAVHRLSPTRVVRRKRMLQQ
jgi:hypothetical protein